jgi:FkbM family methyltransferase
MTLQRAMINVLDRPGGRKLLGKLASWYIRRQTGQDAEVFYDGAWVRRVGGAYVADAPHFEYYANSIAGWEHQVLEQAAWTQDFWFHLYPPSAGDVIVDVGAGSGTDAPAFSQAVGPAGRVLAIEAHPITFRRLELTCKHNHLANVTCICRAVMDQAGQVRIEDGPQDISNAVSAAPTKTSVSVAADTLDEICRQHGVERVDLLKMNIEGAERLAIAGMEQVIRRTRYACIACHDFRGAAGEAMCTRQLVMHFLRGHDFTLVTRDQDPRPFVRDHIHAVNNRLRT